MAHTEKNGILSHGIEDLIDRLKSEGVTAGKNQADEIIKQAKDKAEQIINDARHEAKLYLEVAHNKIKSEQQAAENALQLAARNMRLELRQNFINRFTNEVKRLVGKELSNETTIRQLILLLTTDTAEALQAFKNEHIEIQLPTQTLDFEHIRKNPRLLDGDVLKLLVQGVTSEMLKDGVELKVRTDSNDFVGIKIRIVNNGIEMDLTDEAITTLLLKHIQPRFRALLEGLLQ